MDKIAVLVIDDELTLAKNVCCYLRRFGYAAQAAATGEEGLRQASALHPDIVLTDLHLPGMDGMEVLSRLHEHDPHTKVVIISSECCEANAAAAIAAGACDYVCKPLALVTLKTLLDRISAAA